MWYNSLIKIFIISGRVKEIFIDWRQLIIFVCISIIPNFSRGRPLCVDVTIVDSFGGDLAHASQEPGYNAEQAVVEKNNRYQALVEAERMEFLPFAMESLGGLSHSCETVLKFIAKNVHRIDGVSEMAALNRLHDKLVFNWMLDLGTALAAHARATARRTYSIIPSQ